MREPRAPDVGFLKVDGARLHYCDEGRGFPLLLVHGWALDLEMWNPQAGEWADRLRLIRFDRRGFGLSSGRPSLAADARDIESLIRRLNLSRVAILGMSQGARGAMLAAAGSLRDRVVCLILDGAPFDGSESGEPEVPLYRYRDLARAQGIDAVRLEWRAHPFARLHTADPTIHALVSRMIARYPGTDLLAGPHTTGAAAPSSAIVDVPTLVLNGALETARRRTMGDEISRSLPRAERALIAGAGHLPNLDNPTEYTRCVVPFIDRHSAAQRPPDA